MSNSILYYRTDTTTNTDYSDPTTLPDLQRLNFDEKNVRLEKISRPYQNNITETPVVTSDGTRKINLQDNGVITNVYQLRCSFRMDTSAGSTAYTRLNSFMKRSQITMKYPYGIIGLYVPNMASPFSINPNATTSTTATLGSCIKDVDFEWDVREIKTLYVVITLKTGGTL